MAIVRGIGLNGHGELIFLQFSPDQVRKVLDLPIVGESSVKNGALKLERAEARPGER
jgi:hypothetical protein